MYMTTMNTPINVYELDARCKRVNFKVSSKCQDEVLKKRILEIRKYQRQLERLKALPKVEQKSEEWYLMRYNMITASDFAQALGEGKFGTAKQLIQKKCEPYSNESSISKSNPFFKWGNMFESVAIRIYESKYDVGVHSFGLLRHPKHSFFGASPDGISDLGVMVEIKCPWKRKIDGHVPTQYYYQIQGQLDVCGLTECDYFECEFNEHPSNAEFYSIYDTAEFKGIIVESDDGSYQYSDVNLKKEELQKWDQQNSNKGRKLYWTLRKCNIKRVHRDDAFIKENMKLLADVWKNILHYRDDKKAYEMEVMQSLTIETERLVPGGTDTHEEPSPASSLALSSWAFVDVDENA